MDFNFLGECVMLHPHQKKIEVKDLTVKYGKVIALEHISGTFHPNTLTAIVGPNGGGKSTLIKAIHGQVKISKGSISHNCRHICESGYLPQKNDVDSTFPLTVYEVIGMGLWMHQGSFKSYTKEQHSLIDEAISRVGLDLAKYKKIDQLSGGQFQRMLFARIYIQDASLIILDEPFTAIDVQTCDHLLDIIREWHRLGKTILVVLHNMELVKKYFPETLLLGRTCVGWGATEKVLTEQNINKAFMNIMA